MSQKLFGTDGIRGEANSGVMTVETAVAIGRAVGRPVKTRAFPWWLMPALAPFSEMLREMREMRYLWQHPVRMDNAKLVQALGAEPHTPWDEAVGATLRSLGCH